MIRKTIWRPDTCGCVLEFEWDDAEPAETRQHIPTRGIKLCELHQGLTVENQYAALVEDNTRKNKVEQILTDLVPELAETVQDAERNNIKQLKKPLEHKYLPGRILEIKLPPEIQGKKILENELHSRLKESMKIVII